MHAVSLVSQNAGLAVFFAGTVQRSGESHNAPTMKRHAYPYATSGKEWDTVYDVICP